VTFKREISTEARAYVAGKPIAPPAKPVEVTPDPTSPSRPPPRRRPRRLLRPLTPPVAAEAPR
jgi:hypothetical protein